MIALTSIGTKDLARARKFYDELFAVMGGKVVFERPDGKFISYGVERGAPMFGVCLPYDDSEASPGNGNMVAIAAKDVEQATALYNKAIELGATDEGEPGPRLDGAIACCAYVRDPDGNKLNFFVA